MQKYKWSLYKTLEFLNSRRPDLEIRAAFVSQLADFEQKLIAQERGPQTANWNEVANKEIALGQDKFYSDEELILRNTFLNAQLGFSKSFDKVPDKSDIEPEPALKEEFTQSKIRWIDNNENNKEKLRTNNSEDDLLCQDSIKEVISHKANSHQKSIIKPWKGSGLDIGSKSVCQPSQHVEKVIQKEEISDNHFKSLKNKGDPLILNDINDETEDDKSDLRVSQTQIVHQDPKDNKLIEQFYENRPTKKHYAPKKDQKANNSEPVDLKKRIFVSKKSTSPKRGKKKNVEKPQSNGSAFQDDSQNTSQKDVIVRRIKKKGDNPKAAYSQNMGFVHK